MGGLFFSKRNHRPVRKALTFLPPAVMNRQFIRLSIGIDKKSKSNSFFCFSLYTDKVGVFMKSLSVCLCVCQSSTISVCRTKMWLDTFVRGTVITEKHLKYSH